MAFGGYYCHKFSLPYVECAGDDTLPDYAGTYWDVEKALLREITPELREYPVRMAHYGIFHFHRPFGRSLSGFLRKAQGRHPFDPISGHPSAFRRTKIPDIAQRQAAADRFWETCHSHKDSGKPSPGPKTLEKMEKSEIGIDEPLLASYFSVLETAMRNRFVGAR